MKRMKKINSYLLTLIYLFLFILPNTKIKYNKTIITLIL